MVKITAMKRRCLVCSEPLKGRSDKKFCSDACRNSYHNELNRDDINFIRNVHNILRKNRRILADLYYDGKTKVHKDHLIVLGYNFQFHTNTYTAKNGDICYFCYEQGYKKIDKDHYVLMVRKENIY